MDIVLIAVTVVSLGVALVASVLAWRLSQEEKRRTAARVAALSAAAGVPHRPAAAQQRPAATGPTVPAIASATASAPLPVQQGFLGADEPANEAVNPQRWLAAAAVLVAVLLGGVTVARLGSNARPAGTASASSANSPLELLSLRSEREGSNLAVAGLVRNPPASAAVERVSAVVLLFDQQGAFVTSATAPIDFTKLIAGEESPFVVKVSAPQAVARYRVSFRTDGGTLPHVDRRSNQTASPVALTGASGVKGQGTDDQD